MTDEEKRVIQAARTLVQSHVMDTGHGLELQDAVNALDAAPTPGLTYLVAYTFPGGTGSTSITFRLEPTWDDLIGTLRRAPGIPSSVVPMSACRIASPVPDETSRTWAEVVSTDYVFSAKKGAWFEVIEAWAKGDRVHFRLRGADKTQDLPAITPVKVRRSEMGKTVDMVIGIMSSGPNGYRDAGTDQMDPFIQRVRGIKRQSDTAAGYSTEWNTARAFVLAEAHGQAIEEDGKR